MTECILKNYQTIDKNILELFSEDEVNIVE